MKRVLIFGVFIIVFLFSYSLFADCTKDTDCKGNRICEDGECVFSEEHDDEVEKPKNPSVKKDTGSVTDKKFLIGVDTNLFSYNRLKYTAEDDYGWKDEQKLDNFYTSIGGADLGLRLGGVFYKDMFVVGSYVGFSFSKMDSLDWKHFDFRLAPFFEVSFLRSKVRPFLRFMFDILLSKDIFENDNDWASDESFSWALGASFNAGLHFFATESFSIDLFGDVGFSGGKIEDYDLTRIRAGVGLGFTGWL